MSNTLERIKRLAQEGKIKVSERGYDELVNDDLTATEIIEGVLYSVPLEDYPDYPKGPCVLVLQSDRNGNPIHAVWGIPKNHVRPAVLVTAYRPDPELWDEGFMRRKQ